MSFSFEEFMRRQGEADPLAAGYAEQQARRVLRQIRDAANMANQDPKCDAIASFLRNGRYGAAVQHLLTESRAVEAQVAELRREVRALESVWRSLAWGVSVLVVLTLAGWVAALAWGLR